MKITARVWRFFHVLDWMWDGHMGMTETDGRTILRLFYVPTKTTFIGCTCGRVFYGARRLPTPGGLPLMRGSLVRVVAMDGCMAHIRGEIREGEVIGFVTRSVYGSRQEKMVRVRMHDDQRVEEFPSKAHLWTEHDGRLEYYV